MRSTRGTSMRKHFFAGTDSPRGTSRSLAGIFAVAVLSAACGGGSDTAAGPASGGCAEGEAPLRVAMVTPGPLSDGGYNYFAALGLEQAKEKYCIEYSVAENTPIAENAQAIRGFAADGFDVIIGHGEHNGQPMLQVAEEFPNVVYFVHMGDVDSSASVTSSYARFEESAYLQGIAAAYLSENAHIGFVGFAPLAVIGRAMNGSLEGARSINPEFKLSHIFTNSLVDPSIAREATNALIANGADVIMHIVGGPASAAIIEAAKEAGIPAMGFPGDQSGLAPDTVATSMLVRYPLLVVSQIESVINGTAQGGRIVNYGLDTGVMAIVPLADWVPQEAKDAVAAAAEKIISGELVIDVPASLG